MKKSSLRVKYTVCISVFFALVIALFSFFSIRKAAQICVDTFVAEGKPLVEHGAKYINDSINSFRKVLEDQNPDSLRYKRLHEDMLAMKESSSAKYFYTMVPANSKEYMYVVDGSCDPSDEENFSPLGTLETKDNYGEPALRAMETQSCQASRMTKQEGWGWLITVFAPIVEDGRSIGFIAADYDATALRASIRWLIIYISAISLALIVAVIFIMNVVLNALFGRIQKVTAEINDIATGKADLSQKIPVKKLDEIGELAQSCNQLTESLATMFKKIKEAVASLVYSGTEIGDHSLSTIGDVKKTTERIQEISARSKIQNETMDMVADSSSNVNDSIRLLSSRIGMQSEAIGEISGHVNEISSNIQSIDENVSKISQRYELLVNDSKTGQKDQMTVVDKVGEIQAQAGRLKEANAVIRSIASQTNLLAMNASIEAAHAGAAGKGFAVVAGEIRSLAESSAKQSKSIGDLIKSITEAITGIVDASKLSLSSFQSLDTRIGEIQSMLSEVLASVDEQQAGTKSLLDSMFVVQTSSESIKSASAEMQEQSDKVFSRMDELRTSASEITILTASIKNSIGEILKQAEKSSAESDNNAKLNKEVLSLIDSYKI
ncbi:MAG: methyl-accepting chemotaxis protein [Treponema sp.]|nr:methyl-accepting chemotaxis protein [Treponema sp.]